MEDYLVLSYFDLNDNLGLLTRLQKFRCINTFPPFNDFINKIRIKKCLSLSNFRSVQHENLYINPSKKYCFMKGSPATQDPSSADEGRDNSG
jgi:hypothetical protein